MKKLISCILISILILSCVCVSAKDYSGHWSANAIDRLIGAGIVSGYGDGNVLPDGRLTRAEFAVLVNRAGGFTKSDSAAFIDVRGDEWYAGDLKIARATGYMYGDDYGRANPNAKITRVEALVMVSRAFFPESAAQYYFSDLQNIPEWGRQHVMSLANYGIVKGFEDNSFRPNLEMTRGQIFNVIANIIATPKTGGEEADNSSVNGETNTSTDNDLGQVTPLNDNFGSDEVINKNDRFDDFDFFDDFDYFDNYHDYGSSSGSNNWGYWDDWNSWDLWDNWNIWDSWDNWDFWDNWDYSGGYSGRDEYGYDSHYEYGYDRYDEYGYSPY